MSSDATNLGCGACHGFAVVGADGHIGTVETPLFPPDCNDPDFLVVRVSDGSEARRLMVPTALVQRIDASAQIVRIQRTRDDLLRLPDIVSQAW